MKVNRKRVSFEMDMMSYHRLKAVELSSGVKKSLLMKLAVQDMVDRYYRNEFKINTLRS